MKVTLGKIASYVVGVPLTLFGAVAMLTSPIGGVALLLVGLFALPPVRGKIDDKHDVAFSRGAVVAFVLVGSVVGVGMLSAGGGSGSGEVLVDDTEYTDSTYPFEAEAGDTVTVTAEVNEGPMGIIRVYSEDGDSLAFKKVKTDGEITAQINESGTYYVSTSMVQSGNMDVKATLESED